MMMSHKILDNIVKKGEAISVYSKDISHAESLVEEAEEVKYVIIDTFEFALKSSPDDTMPQKGSFKGVSVLTDKKIIFASGEENIVIPLDQIYLIDSYDEKDTYFTTLEVKSYKVDMIKRQHKGSNDKLKAIISLAVSRLPSRSFGKTAQGSAEDVLDENTLYVISSYAEKIKLLCEKIKVIKVKDIAHEALNALKAIASKKELFAANRKALSKLTSYYLPNMEKLVVAYISIDKDGVYVKESDKLRHQIEESLFNLKEAFNTIYIDMNRQKIMDISSDISALNEVMKLDGLISNDELGLR